MKIEEAIVYLLSTEGRGMTPEAIAREITLRKLYVRKDGQPISTKQIWRCVFQWPEMFVRDGKVIRLMV